jgi:AcrR family transcriptional regulator
MLTAIPERADKVRRRRPGASITRQRILAASMHLFSREGFCRTTVRDIAREAGISDAAIYYHFATKEELLHELLNPQLEPDHWIMERTQTACIRELIEELVREATRVIDENHELLRIILREGLAGDPAAVIRYGQLMDTWDSRLASRLRPFEKTGALAAGSAKTLAREIIYAILMAFEDTLLLRPDPSLEPAERRQEMQAFLSRHLERLVPAYTLDTEKGLACARRGLEIGERLNSRPVIANALVFTACPEPLSGEQS